MKDEKKLYYITVKGCDDWTTITKELTEEEYKLVKEVAGEITETSEYKCMPTMVIDVEDSSSFNVDVFEHNFQKY